MEIWDFLDPIALVFLLAAVVLGLLYLGKVFLGKREIGAAASAEAAGDDHGAVRSYKEALRFANEKPDREMELLDKLEAQYKKHGIEHDLEDYRTLVAQSRVLLKKGSWKALQELNKVNELKSELVDRMPGLP